MRFLTPTDRCTTESPAGFPLPSLPQPVPLAGVGMAANGIVLIRQPYNEDDVEGRGGVIEELGHNCLHAYKGGEGETKRERERESEHAHITKLLT